MSPVEAAEDLVAAVLDDLIRCGTPAGRDIIAACCTLSGAARFAVRLDNEAAAAFKALHHASTALGRIADDPDIRAALVAMQEARR